MKMPFGKHEGEQVHEIPRGYLRWALANLKLSPELHLAMEFGLEKKPYFTIEELNLELEKRLFS
jgi:uncharacterized protein (DUF3820 family)